MIYDEWSESSHDGRSKLEQYVSRLNLFLSGQSLQERLDCISVLEDELGVDAEDYFEWVERINTLISLFVEERSKFGGAIKPQVFKKQLNRADWRLANDESAVINSMLLYGHADNQPLRPHFLFGGTFEGCRLGLKLNDRALPIRDTDASTMERYQITQLNPKILSGLRFEPIDSSSEGRSGDGVEKTVEKKSLLVVPLGNILSLGSRSVKGEKGEENQEKGDNDRDWIDTRFVLFLSIQTDGKPGHLYIVYNRTYAATYGQLNVLGVENPDLNTRFLKFCNKSLSFTVAKVNGEGPLSSQLASSYLVLPTERQHRFKEIQLTPISQSLPEVVESGMNRQSLQWSEGGSPPVGLYLA